MVLVNNHEDGLWVIRFSRANTARLSFYRHIAILFVRNVNMLFARWTWTHIKIIGHFCSLRDNSSAHHTLAKVQTSIYRSPASRDLRKGDAIPRGNVQTPYFR